METIPSPPIPCSSLVAAPPPTHPTHPSLVAAPTHPTHPLPCIKVQYHPTPPHLPHPSHPPLRCSSPHPSHPPLPCSNPTHPTLVAVPTHPTTHPTLVPTHPTHPSLVAAPTHTTHPPHLYQGAVSSHPTPPSPPTPTMCVCTDESPKPVGVYRWVRSVCADESHGLCVQMSQICVRRWVLYLWACTKLCKGWFKKPVKTAEGLEPAQRFRASNEGAYIHWQQLARLCTDSLL